MRALITGRGAMGLGLRTALVERGDDVVALLGRPATTDGGADPSRPDPKTLAPIDVAFDFSHASSVTANVACAIAAGCRAIVVGTTGWTRDRDVVARLVDEADAALVWAPTFSPGAVLFAELAEAAARLFGGLAEYDPYILEWHRRSKPDRPSGTALALAERVLPHLRSKQQARLADGAGAPDPTTLEIVALRAGASPGLHVFGFDAPGESLELRLVARDRSAYVAGALIAADWLLADPRTRRGVHEFASIVTTNVRPPAPAGRSANPGTADSSEAPHASLH